MRGVGWRRRRVNHSLSIVVLPHTLDARVSALPKVKPADVKRLDKLGIETIRDLLLTLPFDWETYGAPALVESLSPGMQATVVGTVTSIAAKVTKYKKLRLTEATIRDDSGDGLRVAWFNQPFVAKQLHKGDRVAVAGMVKLGYGGVGMQNPPHEQIGSGAPHPSPNPLHPPTPHYH